MLPFRIEERTTYTRLERERVTLKLMANDLIGSHIGAGLLAKLICSGQDAEWLHLVMPACLGGDLNSLLDQVTRRAATQAF